MPRQFITNALGNPPAVALVNPKYGHNLAGALRGCAAFNINQLWFTGDRVVQEWEIRGRLPREERMRRYGPVEVCHGDRFYDAFDNTTPVAVEIRPSAESLTDFEHPDNALYVFGPEDGSLGRVHLNHCHRFVIIPSFQCLNLAVAVGIVLADRHMKRQRLGLEPIRPSAQMMEDGRSWIDNDSTFEW